MSLTPEEKQLHRKLIDIPKWVKKELSIEAARLNFDGLKGYIESILKSKAKELKTRDNS